MKAILILITIFISADAFAGFQLNFKSDVTFDVYYEKKSRDRMGCREKQSSTNLGAKTKSQWFKYNEANIPSGDMRHEPRRGVADGSITFGKARQFWVKYEEEAQAIGSILRLSLTDRYNDKTSKKRVDQGDCTNHYARASMLSFETSGNIYVTYTVPDNVWFLQVSNYGSSFEGLKNKFLVSRTTQFQPGKEVQVVPVHPGQVFMVGIDAKTETQMGLGGFEISVQVQPYVHAANIHLSELFPTYDERSASEILNGMTSVFNPIGRQWMFNEFENMHFDILSETLSEYARNPDIAVSNIDDPRINLQTIGSATKLLSFATIAASKNTLLRMCQELPIRQRLDDVEPTVLSGALVLPFYLGSLQASSVRVRSRFGHYVRLLRYILDHPELNLEFENHEDELARMYRLTQEISGIGDPVVILKHQSQAYAMAVGRFGGLNDNETIIVDSSQYLAAESIALKNDVHQTLRSLREEVNIEAIEGVYARAVAASNLSQELAERVQSSRFYVGDDKEGLKTRMQRFSENLISVLTFPIHSDEADPVLKYAVQELGISEQLSDLQQCFSEVIK